LGSLYTAVASFLDARAHGGRWLLRMEDLDRPREVAGSADGILRTLQAFTFVTCDDTRARPLERHGERVDRVCHYRMVTAAATSYVSFWLLPDGRIADFWSSTE